MYETHDIPLERKAQTARAPAMNEYPALRPIEAVPVERDGERMVALYDPARYSEASVMVSIPAFYLLTLMDGGRDIDLLLEDFEKQFGAPITRDDVINIIDRMDSALMLDNERFLRHKESIRRDFLSRPVRPAVFAGQSYPADPGELSGHIDRLISEAPESGQAEHVRAIIVPHIDFRVGADMMAAGWKAARESGAEIFVILGTGHCLSDDFFSCLDKDFATPAGPMRVDRDFLKKLETNFGENIYGQAEAHKNEHSIEFQALFMARLFAGRPEVTAVPILLSFPEVVWDIDHKVFNGERIARFIGALKKTARECGKKVAYVASVDFSHVGARFGDGDALDDSELKRIKADDMELIEAIGKVDGAEFLGKIKEVNQRNRVCGFPALHTLLGALDEGEGDLLEYRQNVEADGKTVVSFATMTLR